MGWLRRTHTLRPSAPPSVPLGDAAVHQLSEQPRDDRRATFVGVHLRTSAVAQEITWRTFTSCPARAVQTGRADTGWTRAAAVCGDARYFDRKPCAIERKESHQRESSSEIDSSR